jgi:hydroxymethylbilane synthase
LGFADRITQCFEVEDMLPAVGQGIIGIECRRDDAWVENLLAPLEDPLARDALSAERALNASLQGGCQVPIAGHARIEGDQLTLDGLVASLDGREQIRGTRRGARRDAAAMGAELGQFLLDNGAARILRDIGLLT